jgi:hypothetical protein
MNRSKIIAIITGAISIILALVYLVIVQILDYRDMQPAPISQLQQPVPVAYTKTEVNHEMVGNLNLPYLLC